MAEETKVIRIVIDSSKAVDGFAAATRAMERMERSQRDAASSLERMERSLDRVGGFMKAHLALIVADIGARFVQMGRDAFNAAAGMGELAEQLGVTVDGVQALQYSAAQNGVKIAQLETGIGKFSQKIGEAAAGSKEMVESLNAMSVKILDAQGRLRPTETLLTDVARAITSIDDPAKRAAASVDYFGKAGTKFLPMLKDMAGGMDTLTARAKAAGVVMSEDTIDKLDKIADRAEVSSLHIRTLFADLGAPIITTSLERVNGLLGSIADQLARGRASGEGFWATVLNDSRAQGRLGSGPNALRLSTPAEEEADRRAKLEAELRDPRNAGRTQMIQEDLDRLNRSRLLDRQAGFESQEDWARRIKLPGSEALPGVSNPAVKGSGEAEADRMRKALQQSRDELDQATAFADAANQGADAIAKLEIHFKALKVAQDVFGKTAAANSNEVQDLTAKLEGQAVATMKLKNLGDFRANTQALRDQNEVLAAEIRLTNELPDIRARELAVIKLTQEEKAKGLTLSEQDRQARLDALATGERLKSQGEEIRRSTELWTAPFKSALESIQRSTADWIDSMLQGLEKGKFSVADFGKIGLSVLRRMAAEIISLAVMRPMLGSVVNGLSSIGIISPGVAASMGYGQGTSGTSLSLPGGSGLGNLFGGAGIGDFFSRPIASLFGSSVPAGGFASVGDLLASGQTGASAAASGIGGLGGISIGQGLGALGGIGMGAYQLFNSRSTGQTIGGIGTMIGGAVSLIPGIGQIAGPIISILSSIVPSLFGEQNTRTHSSTNANLRYGDGGWYTTGGAWGPGANSGQSESALRGLSGSIDSVFDLMGGIKDASKVWGLNASSWTAQGKNWSYTSNATHLVDPNGNREAWRMNMDDMMDTGAAQVAIRSILSGAVGEISTTMKTALEHMRAASTGIKETAESIVFVDEVYERLGKGALTVRAQFRELEKSFSDMTATAEKLGLSLAPIEAEQKKATERLGQDYIDNLIDPIAAQLRAWQDEKASILANTAYIAEHTDVVVDMARINEALLRKEAALKNELYSGAISQLEDAIARLTYGDLANITGAGTLAGMRASFNATVAQARAGDLSAYQRVAGEGLAYADASRNYFASSPEYEAIRKEIATIMVELKAQTEEGKGSSAESSASTQAAAITAQSTMRLEAMFRESQDENRELKAQIAELVDVTKRLLSRSAA